LLPKQAVRRRVGKDEVTVVIPVKNKAAAIGSVIDELYSEGYQNILVVDGYSTDETIQLVKSKGVQFIHQHGRGKTGAIKTAIEHVATPYLLVIDGDYTYPVADIERLLVHCANYAQVIGVRDRRNISLVHRFGNWVITRAFNLLFGASVSDVCSGMYLLNTEAAKQLELSSGGFVTEVEIATQTVANHSLAEVPIGYRPRVGKGELSTWDGFSILRAVINLSWKYNPIFLSSALASLTIIPALAVSGWVLLQQYLTGVWHSGWALIAVVLLLFSTQSFAVAAISALLKRSEQRIRLKLQR